MYKLQHKQRKYYCYIRFILLFGSSDSDLHGSGYVADPLVLSRPLFIGLTTCYRSGVCSSIVGQVNAPPQNKLTLSQRNATTVRDFEGR